MFVADKKRYENLKYNRCGNSGLMLPAVSLGLWHNFGDSVSLETKRSMILGAFDRGITHFDLANNYGPFPGAAEISFGQVLKTDLMPYRDEIIVSTKAGYKMWDGPYGNGGSKKYLVSSLDQSLKRMGLDYVDIFYSHRFDPDTPIEETMDALAGIVKSGKALYVGVSNYDAAQTEKAYDLLSNKGIHLLIHQPKYSMLNRWVEDGLLDVVEEKGMGAIAYSPLAQGLLTNRYFNGIPKNSRAGGASVFLSENNITDKTVEKSKKLNEIASKRNQSLAQMALSWVLKDNRMTSVIIGASSLNQIDENISAANDTKFSSQELEKIETILSQE